MNPEIKNIIFDLGGVILDIDYDRPVKAFKKLGAENFEQLFAQSKQIKLFDQFDIGEVTPAQFRKEVRKHLPEDVTDEQIDAAWNSILGDLPSHRIVVLKMLAQRKYRLFLLSNTNSIHVKAFTNYLDATYGKGLFKTLFEKQYFSNQIGMRKPTKKVFDHILKENGLKASETLFIDDSPEHVEGAKKAGLHGYWLQEPETINDYFKAQGLE